MDWDYVWIAIIINFLAAYLVPRILRKPTGIQVIDDVVLYMNAQKSFLLASSLVLGAVVYASHSWIDSRSEATSAMSVDTSPFSAK
jgi:hypothetical protein